MFLRKNSPEALLLREKFLELPSTSIAITVYNWEDGGGDSRNAIDAFQAMKWIAPNHQVKLFMIVGPKKKDLVLKIKNDCLPDENLFLFKLGMTAEEMEDQKIDQAEIIIFPFEKRKNELYPF